MTEVIDCAQPAQQFRVEFFVAGKFRGSVIVVAANKRAAFAKSTETNLYKFLNKSGKYLTMVKWSAHPVE